MGLATYMKSELNMHINYTKGKILWKKCLMKFRYLYGNQNIKTKKDNQKLKSKFYMGKSNARAIINFQKQIENLSIWRLNPKLSFFYDFFYSFETKYLI